MNASTPAVAAPSNVDLMKAEVAWDLVVRHQYPMQTVAQQLRVSHEELQQMLLALLNPPRKHLQH